MSAHIEPQVITYNGKPAFAVIPWDVYEQLTSGSKEGTCLSEELTLIDTGKQNRF